MTATRPATAPDAPPSIEGLPDTSRSDAHPGQQPGSRRDEGVDHRHRGKAVRLERRAGVEAEPADPQQPRADHGQRQRMRRHRFLQMADARPGERDPDQARDAGIDVHHRAAGEVDRAEPEQQPVRRPHHVRQRRVDDRQPQQREQHHRREAHALDQGADDQRRGDRREAHLEGGEDQLGDRLARASDRPQRRVVSPASPALARSPISTLPPLKARL